MKQREKSIIVDLNEPIEALCTNKKRTRVSVAIKTGKFWKNVKIILGMKILSINDNVFELPIDSIKSKKGERYWSLSWNPLKGIFFFIFDNFIENIIASTLYNGAVLVWDIDHSRRYLI